MDQSNLARRIQYLRSTLGLSQSGFAKMIGRTASFIAKIELGKSRISEETLTQICNVFHVYPAWLSEGKGPVFESGYEQQQPDWSGLPYRIKMYRKEHGMTQAELAAAIGCSKSQLTSVELGRVTPSYDWMERFCSRFQISKSWLLSGTGRRDELPESSKNSLGTIYQFFRENEHARAVAMEAITAYTTGKNPDVWEQLSSSIKKNSDSD